MQAWKVGAALASGYALLLAGASLRAQESISWATDYAAAQQTARATGKPLLVAFRCER